MERLISKAHDLANATPLFSKLKALDIHCAIALSQNNAVKQ